MRQSILFGAICFGPMLPKFTIAAETSTPRQLLAQYVIELQTAVDGGWRPNAVGVGGAEEKLCAIAVKRDRASLKP